MMRVLNIVVSLMTLAVAFTAYHVKYQALEEGREVRRLTAEIATERDAIQVLRAEWSLLNEPGELESLAKRYTELQPLEPAQMATLADLPARPEPVPGLEQRSSLGGVAGIMPHADPRAGWPQDGSTIQ